MQPHRPPLKTETALGPASGYFQRILRILSSPTSFFEETPLTGGTTGPLVFAIVTSWIGALLEFSHSWLTGRTVQLSLQQFGGFQGFNEWGEATNYFQQASSPEMVWFQGMGKLILDPFFTLFTLFVGAFLVWMGAKLFVRPGVTSQFREIRFDTILKISCFAVAPAWFRVVPWAGSVIVWIYSLVILTLGIRTVYQTDLFRAFLAAVFPNLMALLPFALFVFFITSLFAAFLMMM